MKIIALMPVRNEEWILRVTLPSVLDWVDEVLVLDHASTDMSAEIVREYMDYEPGRVHLIEDTNPLWAEMEQRQRLLETGRKLGGTHFAIVDADEMISYNLVPTMRARVEALKAGEVLQLPWVMLWNSPHWYRSDATSKWVKQFASVAFADKPELCWTTPADGYAFHHRHPYNSTHKKLGQGLKHGGLLHFQHVDRQRLLAKQALYKMQEVVRWPGRKTPEQLNAMYDQTVDEQGLQRTLVPGLWFPEWFGRRWQSQAVQTPWQQVECQRLMQQYGPEKFAGLNLYGVV